MIIFFGIFGIIGVACLLYCLSKMEDELQRACLFTLTLSCCIMGLCLGSDLIRDEPRAMDVYRNRTTLQISYKVVEGDTIAKDTVVVFKKNLD